MIPVDESMHMTLENVTCISKMKLVGSGFYGEKKPQTTPPPQKKKKLRRICRNVITVCVK